MNSKPSQSAEEQLQQAIQELLKKDDNPGKYREFVKFGRSHGLKTRDFRKILISAGMQKSHACDLVGVYGNQAIADAFLAGRGYRRVVDEVRALRKPGKRSARALAETARLIQREHDAIIRELVKLLLAMAPKSDQRKVPGQLCEAIRARAWEHNCGSHWIYYSPPDEAKKCASPDTSMEAPDASR